MVNGALTAERILEAAEEALRRFGPSRVHNPAHAAEWSHPGIDAAFERVWELVVAGLEAQSKNG
jgi:hypothetical protein